MNPLIQPMCSSFCVLCSFFCVSVQLPCIHTFTLGGGVLTTNKLAKFWIVFADNGLQEAKGRDILPWQAVLCLVSEPLLNGSTNVLEEDWELTAHVQEMDEWISTKAKERSKRN